MLRPVRAIAPFLCLAVGCVPSERAAQLVHDNPFAGPLAAPPASQSAYAPAATDVAARVDTLGRAILAANPQLGVQPLFRTIGTGDVEMFHRGTSEITLTEGLVRQCPADGALAAVLCMELGRMVSEREALVAPRKRTHERGVPIDVGISGDNGADRTRLAELAALNEPDRRRTVQGPALPPDPQALARTYLTKAGYQAGELDGVQQQLRTAEASGKFEKQLATPGPARPWTQ